MVFIKMLSDKNVFTIIDSLMFKATFVLPVFATMFLNLCDKNVFSFIIFSNFLVRIKKLCTQFILYSLFFIMGPDILNGLLQIVINVTY